MERGRLARIINKLNARFARFLVWIKRRLHTLRIDHVLFDAETLEIIQYRKTRMLPGNKILQSPFIERIYSKDRSTVEEQVFFEINSRKIKFYQIDYDKIKIRDQFLTLPVEKHVSLFFDNFRFDWRSGSLPSSNYDYSSRLDYITEKIRNTITTPDLLSFARETHKYKYSDYRLFDVDVKIEYGTAEEEP